MTPFVQPGRFSAKRSDDGPRAEPIYHRIFATHLASAKQREGQFAPRACGVEIRLSGVRLALHTASRTTSNFCIQRQLVVALARRGAPRTDDRPSLPPSWSR